mmetsp:Transcript_38291/g.70707  ORF Transcript_38291/g.70707 Transcript_38291/m.70707 type:complete len:133 (-) Transcript_38291:1280-1678(-)
MGKLEHEKGSIVQFLEGSAALYILWHQGFQHLERRKARHLDRERDTDQNLVELTAWGWVRSCKMSIVADSRHGEGISLILAIPAFHVLVPYHADSTGRPTRRRDQRPEIWVDVTIFGTNDALPQHGEAKGVV